MRGELHEATCFLTPVWLLLPVDPHVCLQVSVLIEMLLTDLADVRFLASVCSHMDIQSVSPSIRLATYFADKRLLARVRAHVNFEMSPGDERLCASFKRAKIAFNP